MTANNPSHRLSRVSHYAIALATLATALYLDSVLVAISGVILLFTATLRGIRWSSEVSDRDE